ncbi:hypothetical protein HYS31_06955 [Candidatus Woesearchaeota archaeon]|nr:hypothetical protein [Candidatus Woesearchaeota archaeon]
MQTVIVAQSGKNFEDRVIDFLKDLREGKGFTEINRGIGHSGALLQVGIGDHTGLVFKNGYVTHAQIASEYYHKLIEYFKNRGYEPYGYELIKPKFVAVGEHLGVIQEYFTEPTLYELDMYFIMMKQKGIREKKLGRQLNALEINYMVRKFRLEGDSGLRCEQLLKQQQNTDITLEQIVDVEREFKDDWEYLQLWVKSENVIALGRKENQSDKMGLVIVDY